MATGGKYGNEDILAAFLETIIRTKITKLEIQNGELPKNDKENKKLRQDNKKLKTLLLEAVDKNNRFNCEKIELLKLINKLQESNKKNISPDSSTYESIRDNLQAQNANIQSIRDNLQAQNANISMNFASQLYLIAASHMMSTPYGCLNNPYMPAANPQFPYPYTWH